MRRDYKSRRAVKENLLGRICNPVDNKLRFVILYLYSTKRHLMKNKFLWILFAVMAIAIGLYPGIYFLIDREFGLLASKENELLTNVFWNAGFYTHITLGGLALLIGWTQFSTRRREAWPGLHRNIGKIYVVSALLSALAAIYISFYSTGGLIASLGFFSLGCIWFLTTLRAFLSIRKGNISEHQTMMIYSYASCFAAVTLRIWLPLLVMWYQDFVPAYRVVAWLCWVPNLIIAYWIVKRTHKTKSSDQLTTDHNVLV